MCLGNAFSVDVINHAWEQKFIYCTVDILFALRLETKGIQLLYTEVYCDQF